VDRPGGAVGSRHVLNLCQRELWAGGPPSLARNTRSYRGLNWCRLAKKGRAGTGAWAYALGMHLLLRWLVGTVASLLGLSLLLVRWGFWASGSTVVEDAHGMRAVLIAIQTEPAVLVYGAIVFLLLVGFALLITTSKWKKWVTGH
jgi:hypothetical protein